MTRPIHPVALGLSKWEPSPSDPHLVGPARNSIELATGSQGDLCNRSAAVWVGSGSESVLSKNPRDVRIYPCKRTSAHHRRWSQKYHFPDFADDAVKDAPWLQVDTRFSRAVGGAFPSSFPKVRI